MLAAQVGIRGRAVVFPRLRVFADHDGQAAAPVIYPLDGGTPTGADIKKNAENDKRNRWGDRVYFWNCRRAGGDYDWHTNNLATALASLRPEQITAAWTFSGIGNLEDKSGPVIPALKVEQGRTTLTFSESVTVKGKPRLALRGGDHAPYESGSGGDKLVFEMPGDAADGIISVDLNGGAIIATTAAGNSRNRRSAGGPRPQHIRKLCEV